MQQQQRLTTRGFAIRKDGLSNDEVQALRKQLTMTPLNGMNINPYEPPASFPIFHEDKTHIYLPKYFGLQRYQKKNLMTFGEDLVDSTAISCAFTGKLRPYQFPAVEAYMSACKDPTRLGGILSLPCGQGKTIIALKIIEQVAKKTLVLVPKDFLLRQWRENIGKFLPELRVGVIKGKHVDVKDRDIIIGTIQSLSMKNYPDEVFRGIGLLVVDECHRIGTQVFSRALLRRCFMHTLGLSATVRRKDGMSCVFINFLGDVVYRGQPRADRVHVVQIQYCVADEAYCHEDMIASIGKPNMSRMINRIASYSPRNELIVHMIAQVVRWEPLRKVLVLSDRKDQLAALHAGLTAREVQSGFYYGGLKPEQLAESERKQVLLATFAYAAEGMDCPGLDTLFLVSPKSDIEQSCGRILREQPQNRKRVPVIVDVADWFSLFLGQARKRAAYYKKKSYLFMSAPCQVGDGVGVPNVPDLLSRFSEGEGAEKPSGGEQDEDAASGEEKE